MATENYTVVYIANPSSFVAGSRQVEQALAAVDLATQRTKQNLNGFASGAGRSATNAAKKINDLNDALKGVPTAAGAASGSLKGLSVAGDKAAKSTDILSQLTGGWVTKIMAIAAAWKVATDALNVYSKAAEDAKRTLNTGAQAGLEKRDDAREYSRLLGKQTVDDDTIKRLFSVGQAGGMSFDESLKYGNQFFGSLEAGKNKGHITDEQTKILEKEGSAFGSSIGLDPETAGDMTGVLAQYVDLTKGTDKDPNQKLTTEEGVDKAMGQLGALAKGLQDGRGQISVLARKELATSAGMLASGHVKDHAEMAALASVGSTISTANGSGTTVKQMDRLVNESLGEEGEWLKSIGVRDQKGSHARLKALKTHIDAQRAAAPDPAKFDAKEYLQSKGFHENGELDATLGFMANMDVLDARVDQGRRIANDGKSVRAASRAFMASPAGQKRQAGAINEAGVYEQSKRRQRLAIARQAAHGQLAASHQIDEFGTNLVDGFLDGTINNVNPETAKEHRINDQVWANFRAAAKKAGIEDQIRQVDPAFIESSRVGVGRNAYTREAYDGQQPARLDEALNRFGPMIEAKGVSINGATIDNEGNKAPEALPAARPAGAADAGGAVQRIPAPGPKVAALGSGGGAMLAAARPAAIPPMIAAPGGGAGAAPGAPRVAVNDQDPLHKAAEKLDRAASMMMSAGRMMASNRPVPGSHLSGDDYTPYRA